jgi:WD40 repeat protein
MVGVEHLRIYISSVSHDLREYREEVCKRLSQLGHEAITMGDAVVDGRSPLKKCLDEIASCDLYVGIFAWRYGDIPDKNNPERKSIAELEYRQAGLSNLPRLIFLLDAKTPWPPVAMDAITGDGEHGLLVATFREELAKEHDASFFTSSQELTTLVGIAVVRTAGAIEQQRAAAQAAHKAQALAAYVQRIPSPPPPLPTNFVARPDVLDQIRHVIFDNGNQRPVVLTASASLGGIGKSVLAAALCHDPSIIAAFPDGVIWIAMGREPGNLVSKLAQVGRALGDSDEQYHSAEASSSRLRTLLQDKAALLVFDDVWHEQHIDPFRSDAPRCCTLITTRDSSLAQSLGAAEVTVEPLHPDHAVQLLCEWAEREDPAFPEIATRLDALPLVLQLAGAQLRKGMEGVDWMSAFENRLSQLNVNRVAATPPETLHVCLSLALDHLSDPARALYSALGIFPENTPVPQEVVIRLWQKLQPSMTIEACSDLITELLGRALIAYDAAAETVIVHELVYEYLREQLGERLATMNRVLLEAYNADNTPWASIADDGYLYRHLAFHLREAQREDVLRHLLFDLSWLQTKLDATDVHALVNDYNFLPNDTDLHLLQDAIRLSAQVVAQDKTQLRSQLYGRLMDLQTRDIEAFVQQLKKDASDMWLRLLVPTLTPPGGSLLRTLHGHNHWVNAVAITPDGKQMVSAADDQTLKVWDLRTGQELHTLRGHSNAVHAVAITPDGEQAVSASADQTLKVWDLRTGQELHTLRGHNDWVNAVAITHDGLQAVSASVDQTLKVWDLRTGQHLRTLHGHNHRVNAVVITPDDTQAVSASVDQTLKVWDLRTGQHLRTLRGHNHRVSSVALTPDGKQVVSASADQTLKVWDLRTGQHLRTLRSHTDWVTAVAVSPDGTQIISASIDQTLKVWDLRTGQEEQTLRGHSHRVNAVAITPDGMQVVSASMDQTLKVWDLRTGQHLRTLRSHNHRANAVAITPDGAQAVSASDDQTLKIWDLRTGQELHTLRGHSHRISAIAITPDGKQIISASADQTFKVWDLHTGQEMRTLRDHSQWVRALAITPDGAQVISTSGNQRLEVWDLRTGQEVYPLRGHSHRISAVAISPDGEQAVSVSDDQTLKVWDLRTGQEVHTLRGHSHWVSAVAITPNSTQAISASADQTLKVWDLRSGQEVRTLRGHNNWIKAVALTPDGAQIASASVDQTLKVWDLDTGRLLATFSADAPLLTCAVAPDGVTIVAGDSSGRVHFLKLEGGPKSKV